MGWKAADVPDLRGRTVVVTGANSGIGFEATRVLAGRGATVVMACRSVDRGREAADEIRSEIPGVDLVVEELDLADLESVRAFADRIDREVDVLANNAGVMAIPRTETADGFETQFGVNHLGHFALTGLLLDRLAADARVVTVSSGVHERGEIDFADLRGERAYDRWDAYARSKLANLLFAFELDRRFRAAAATDGREPGDRAGTRRIGVGVHPGFADTRLQSRGPEMAGERLRLAAMKVLNALFAQPPSKGALPTLYAATAPDVEGGAYYGPGGLLNMRGPPERQEPAEQARDRETARRLWDVSEDLTGVSYDLPVPSATAES